MRKVGAVIFMTFCLHYIGGSVLQNSVQKDDEGELISLAVLYRHGDATPSKASSSFPNDPYIAPVYWPMGYNQVTNSGKNHIYNLGLQLRDRYSTFLPTEYSVNDVYVRSTDLDVTLMSAEVGLSAFYPPRGSQVWNQNIPWQPIAVHTIPLEDDQILYMGSDCPKFYQLYDAIYNNALFSSVNNENAQFYQQLSELTGWNITDFSYIAKLTKILNMYFLYDESYLPPWAESLDQDKLAHLAALDYVRYTATDGLKRLGAGPFFSNLFTHFENVVNNGADAKKLLLLVGHESTLIAALNTMGVFDNFVAQFGSVMIWELRQRSDGEYFIKLFYRNERWHDLNQLFDKSYEDFKSEMAPYTVDMKNWYQECLIEN